MKLSVKFPLQISIFTSSYLSLFTYMYLHEYCQKKINLFFNQYFLLKNFVVMNQNTCNNYTDFKLVNCKLFTFCLKMGRCIYAISYLLHVYK